ncbi:hypothetical protein WJX84_004975 [Apatococcus fuscideae]|uniref:Protein kinase domain-containing protein n=1 Tax=Apatococcus fuscideae TaxID=2026836 RepID=A0AAW1SRW6_9CHLO
MLRAGVGQQLTSDPRLVIRTANCVVVIGRYHNDNSAVAEGAGDKRGAHASQLTMWPPPHDSQVLQKPIKQALQSKEVRNVFGFDRDMRQAYNIGKVLGAGSFGVVRTVTHKGNKRKYACKTIPKVPKRGDCTPRYLLKIQAGG